MAMARRCEVGFAGSQQGERVTASPPRERERGARLLWPLRCLVLRVAMLVLRCSFKHILAWHLFGRHVSFYMIESATTFLTRGAFNIC
jgi:hypothetical protein